MSSKDSSIKFIQRRKKSISQIFNLRKKSKGNENDVNKSSNQSKSIVTRKLSKEQEDLSKVRITPQNQQENLFYVRKTQKEAPTKISLSSNRVQLGDLNRKLIHADNNYKCCYKVENNQNQLKGEGSNQAIYRKVYTENNNITNYKRKKLLYSKSTDTSVDMKLIDTKLKSIVLNSGFKTTVVGTSNSPTLRSPAKYEHNANTIYLPTQLNHSTPNVEKKKYYSDNSDTELHVAQLKAVSANPAGKKQKNLNPKTNTIKVDPSEAPSTSSYTSSDASSLELNMKNNSLRDQYSDQLHLNENENLNRKGNPFNSDIETDSTKSSFSDETEIIKIDNDSHIGNTLFRNLENLQHKNENEDFRNNNNFHDTKDMTKTLNRDNCFEKFSIKDFQFRKTLGTGTFGRVYLTSYGTSENIYAMKIMNVASVIKQNQVEHVNNEKDILAQLHHPYIVDSYWFCLHNFKLYMLFEYIPGGELFTYLRNKEQLDADEVLFYVAEVVVVFEFLHSKKIVYRDLKPENILIGIDGHLKFTDFGFSKILHNAITYTLCGTPEYLSPECIMGKGYDYSCDWWALGIITYEMFVGDPPFSDVHPFGLYQKILEEEVYYPDELEDTDQGEFIDNLLQVQRKNRIGKGQFGAKEVKEQAWLKDINWDDACSKRLKPPFIPVITATDDTSNFDDFDETWEPEKKVNQIDLNKFSTWPTES